MTNFMPHGHCYFWQSDILWPMVAGELMHVVAYFGLAGMSFFLCTRKLGNVSSWMPPFLFLFACFILTCGISHAINIVTIWKPFYGLQAWWSVLSGSVSMVTLAATVYHRKDILVWLGAGYSKYFASQSFEGSHPSKSDCDKCVNLLHDLRDKD